MARVVVGKPAVMVGGVPIWLPRKIPASPAPVHIFVRFEIWNPHSTNASQYDPVGAGIPIDLMDYNVLEPHTLLDSKDTDANGLVTFVATDYARKSGENNPDIYFLARVKGIKLVGLWTPPDDWSTKGWSDINGNAGYYPWWDLSDLGTLANPLVFRIGFDFHIQLSYTRYWPPDVIPAPAPQVCVAPPGIPVVATAYSPDEVYRIPQPNAASFRTNKNGEVHGLVFNIHPWERVTFDVQFQIADPSINLQPAWVIADAPGQAQSTFDHWVTGARQSDPDYIVSEYGPQSWIGTPSAPKPIKTTTGDKNKALFFLSVFYELSACLFHITAKTWPGFKTKITYFLTAIGTASYSWPVGAINMHPRDHWSRDVIVHETSHQIMWQESDMGSIRVGFEYLAWNGTMVHYTALRYSGFQALTEGWAELFEAIFSRLSLSSYNNPPYDVSRVDDYDDQFKMHNWIPLVPPFNGIGENVEGAFANALWELFREYVVGSVAADAHVAEVHNDYEVVNANPWVTDTGVQFRFRDTIWRALGGLANRGKTTADFIDTMRANNLVSWRTLAGYFQSFNMSLPLVEPKFIPLTAPNAGITVTITGVNFVDSMQVLIDGRQMKVSVISSQMLSCIILPAKMYAPTGGTVSVDLIIKFPLREPIYRGNNPSTTWTVQMITLVSLPGGFTYQG